MAGGAPATCSISAWTRTTHIRSTSPMTAFIATRPTVSRGAHRRVDGRRVDAVRSGRPGCRHQPDRRPRRRRRHLAAAGVGRTDPDRPRPAAAVGLLRLGFSGHGRPRSGHVGNRAVLHGLDRAAPTRHRERARVPGTARRRRLARPRWLEDLASRRRSRRCLPDPAVDRRVRRPRRRVRARCRRLLGCLHRPHPACRRSGRRV